MNEIAWAKIMAERENLMPTPPIGERVQWFENNNQKSPRGAEVTGIEEPGRVKLKVTYVNGFHRDMSGVYHVSHPVHLKHNNQTTVRCGSWQYLREKVPNADYEYHKSILEVREKNLLASEAAQKLAEENHAKLEQELKAAPKRRPPDPIAGPKKAEAVSGF